MACRQRGQLDPPASEEAVRGDEQASGRPSIMAANAASISRLVLALKNWTCSLSA